ncbi:MAG TPA: hypothetical protein PKE12_13070 [Kiritimatiellia bacterium]|nr:hypothetical protein [Kiritimatiellia bacterium]
MQGRIFSKSRSGFTLVEMLAVILVVFLLLSLLAPSLQRARDVSLTAVCLGNIRQIATAGFVQFSDNEGQVLREVEDNDIGWRAPWRLYLVGAGPNGQDHYMRTQLPNGTTVARSWGLLYRDTYVEDSRAFYCPSRERDESTTEIKHKDYWGAVGTGPVAWRTRMNFSGAARRVSAGYQFNAYRIEQISAPDIFGRMSGFTPQTERIPRYKQALVFDMIRNTGAMSYHAGPAMNVALVDGSARTYPAQRLIGRINSGLNNADENWNVFDLLMEDLVRPN